jgi:hypothetical protein
MNPALASTKMAEHDFAEHLFPLFDQKNASIIMTSDAIVATHGTNATNNTISFDDGESTNVDVEIKALQHQETHCYREGRGKYQFDYERLSALTPHSGRAEMVSVTLALARQITELIHGVSFPRVTARRRDNEGCQKA